MASIPERDSIPVSQRKKVMTSLNCTDALALVEHGSDITLNISTPVGTKFVCQTNFIGVHSESYFLTQIPQISSQDLNYYFQVGFWSNIRAISPRGEGAIVVFRSQLQHVIDDPIPMALFSIPSTMQVTQLRKEPRFEVNLNGKAMHGESRIDCEIRDISRHGCRFITSPLCHSYQIDDHIAIRLQVLDSQPCSFGDLTGRICNIQRSTHYARYGIEFDDFGKANASELLNKLKFTGTKLTLNLTKK